MANHSDLLKVERWALGCVYCNYFCLFGMYHNTGLDTALVFVGHADLAPLAEIEVGHRMRWLSQLRSSEVAR